MSTDEMTVWLCPDCTEVACVKLTSLTSDFGNYPEGHDDGYRAFSKDPCFLCESPLHGDRYRFVRWLNDEPATLPCRTCGTPVDADIHAEELGFCIPCQHDYFDSGECDECGASYDTSSRDGRCGDCGNCSDHCTHNNKENS